MFKKKKGGRGKGENIDSSPTVISSLPLQNERKLQRVYVQIEVSQSDSESDSKKEFPKMFPDSNTSVFHRKKNKIPRVQRKRKRRTSASLQKLLEVNKYRKYDFINKNGLCSSVPSTFTNNIVHTIFYFPIPISLWRSRKPNRRHLTQQWNTCKNKKTLSTALNSTIPSRRMDHVTVRSDQCQKFL